MRQRLCFLVGFVQAMTPQPYQEWPDLTQLTDEQMVESVIRMLAANDTERGRVVRALYLWLTRAQEAPQQADTAAHA